jgi:hypothetical protein
MIIQAFAEESMSRKLIETEKKGKQTKSKVKSMLIIFCTSRGFFFEKFVLEGKKVNFTYYCDVLRRLNENMRKLRPELWRRKNSLLRHDNAPSHFLFHQGTFDQTQHYCRPPNTPLFSVFPIEDKSENPLFWHN